MDNSRSIQIDAMRGLAALAVAIYHLKLIAIGGPLQVPWWLEKVTSLGGAGVSLFFVLSAYLLTKITDAEKVNPTWSAGFLVKRWFRIAPMFIFTYFAWSLYKLVFGGPLFPPAEISAWTFSLLFNLSPTNAHSSIFAGWTVGVEILFYLLFPIAIITLRKTGQIFAAIAVAMVIRELVSGMIVRSDLPANVIEQYLMINFFSHLPVFLLGMLIAKIDQARLPSGTNLFLAGISIFIFTANLSGKLNFLFDYRIWNAIASAALLYAAIISKPTTITKAMAPLGVISFSIYLMHGPVFKSMGSLFVDIYSLGLGVTASFLLCCLIGTAAVSAVSAVTYLLIEKPFMEIGRKLAVRITSKPKMSAVAATA